MDYKDTSERLILNSINGFKFMNREVSLYFALDKLKDELEKRFSPQKYSFSCDYLITDIDIFCDEDYKKSDLDSMIDFSEEFLSNYFSHLIKASHFKTYSQYSCFVDFIGFENKSYGRLLFIFNSQRGDCIILKEKQTETIEKEHYKIVCRESLQEEQLL